MHRSPNTERWRETHLGRLLAKGLERFDARVLALMARNEELGLALANLAARGSLDASHVQITRHLPVDGCSLSALAARAGISKQAMGKLVDQSSAWDLVSRLPDRRDRRSVQVVFTASGVLWLNAYRQAVQQAEYEFSQSVGADVAAVVHLGLEAYLG